MRRSSLLPLLVCMALAGPSGAAERERHSSEKKAPPAWLPDEMPLPLVVRDPKDLEFKRVVEREYLIFNLLAGGKLAYDEGRFSEAADHWETLLQLPNLDRDIDQVVRPLAIDARKKAGQEPKVAAAPPPPPEPPPEPEPPPKPKARRTTVDVHGTVTGGGSAGPGGAVVWMKRTDGKTPLPVVRRQYLMAQRDKEFIPHVLAVPVGATVSFRNDDDIFHDVFTPNGFDLGLYKNGLSRTHTFDHPGATPLYCNIHAHMNAWVVAVDTPYYSVADSNGRFTIRNVPPGEYDLEVWHEGSTTNGKASAHVETGMSPVALTVGNDRRPLANPPDKYGRPRQRQLGY